MKSACQPSSFTVRTKQSTMPLYAICPPPPSAECSVEPPCQPDTCHGTGARCHQQSSASFCECRLHASQAHTVHPAGVGRTSWDERGIRWPLSSRQQPTAAEGVGFGPGPEAVARAGAAGAPTAFRIVLTIVGAWANCRCPDQPVTCGVPRGELSLLCCGACPRARRLHCGLSCTRKHPRRDVGGKRRCTVQMHP